MKKEPDKKIGKLPWVVCICLVFVIVLVRLVGGAAGIAFSDTLTRVMGYVQLAAAAVAAFFYARWKQQYK